MLFFYFKKIFQLRKKRNQLFLIYSTYNLFVVKVIFSFKYINTYIYIIYISVHQPVLLHLSLYTYTKLYNNLRKNYALCPQNKQHSRVAVRQYFCLKFNLKLPQCQRRNCACWAINPLPSYFPLPLYKKYEGSQCLTRLFV